MAINGVGAEKQVRLGSDYPIQVLTVTGSPTGGTFALRYKNKVTTSIAYNASAATVQTAIRTISDFSTATVSGSAGGPWTVTLNCNHTVISKFEVLPSLTGGSTPWINVTATEKPLLWNVHNNSLIAASIAPVAGKTLIPGTSSERGSQTKATEWIGTDLTGGYGRYHLKESEQANFVWDSSLMTFLDRQITLPGLVTTPTIATNAAQFNWPVGIATDGTNLYITDTNNYTIRQEVIGSTAVTTLAGSAGVQGDVDATGTAARFGDPTGICVTGGNLYVCDDVYNKVKKVVIATGVVTTFAGSGASGFTDATGTAATFEQPPSICTDGTNLYVGCSSGTIRQIVIATAVVTTLAGSGEQFGSTDGTGSSARFGQAKSLRAMCVTGGNLYVCDATNYTIRKVVIATGVVTTFAGTVGVAGTTNGTGTAATFNGMNGIETDGTNLYVSDNTNHIIRKVVISTAEVTTFAGTAGSPGTTDGTGAAARFLNMNMSTITGGNMYLCDSGNHAIRKIVLASGVVTTIGGTPGISGSVDGTGATGSEPIYHAGHCLPYGGSYRVPIYAAKGGNVCRISMWDRANTRIYQVTTNTVTNGQLRDMVVYKNVAYIAFGTTTTNQYIYFIPHNTPASSVVTAVTASLTGQVLAFAVFDNKLYRICSDGSIAHTTAPSVDGTTSRNYAAGGDWTTSTGKYTGWGDVVGWQVWKGPDSAAALYLVTTDGLYWYDVNTERLVLVSGFAGLTSDTIDINGGNGATTYNGNLVFIANNSVWSWDGRTFRNIGPNVNHGLPTGSMIIQEQMYCRSLHASNLWLFVAMTNSTDTAGMVLGYLNGGWHPIIPYTIGLPCRAALISSVTSPRLYSGYGQYVPFNDATTSPYFWSGQTYAASGSLITPWYDRDLVEIAKAWWLCRVRVSRVSSTETVIVGYQIDNVAESTSTSYGSDPRSHWVQLLDSTGAAATINSTLLGGASTGVVDLYFDRKTAPDGTNKYSEGVRNFNGRLRIDLARGTDSTKTPILEAWALANDAKFDLLRSYVMTLDCHNTAPDGRAPDRQIADIIQITSKETGVPFAFEDDTLLVGYVDYFRETALETGYSPVTDGDIKGPLVSITFSERASRLSVG